MTKTYHAVIFTSCPQYSTKAFGAHKIAHELRQHGYSVLVVNHIETMSIEELLKIVQTVVSEQTLFVGVSNTYLNYIGRFTNDPLLSWFQAFLPHGAEADLEFATAVKQKNPGCKIVMGGARTHANYKNKVIDYAVIGYADISVIQLAKFLHNGTPITVKQYKNVWGINIIEDDVAKDFDFANSSMTWCDDDVVLHNETLPLEISRGCIFRCKFCNFRLNGKQSLDFLKCTDTIEKEMLHNYQSHGVTSYRLLDDTFNDSEEKINAMWDISKRLPFKPLMGGYARLDLLTAKPHTIERMVEMGFRIFYFGIETLNRRTGSIIGKGGDPERQIEVLRHMKKTYGDDIVLQGSFIVGLPGESKNSVEATMQRVNSGDIPLDVPLFQALQIRKTADHRWTSPFDLEWKDHGYTEIKHENYDQTIMLNWKNEHMTYHEAVALVTTFLQQNKPKPIPMLSQYQQLTQPIIDAYKQKLWAHLGISYN